MSKNRKHALKKARKDTTADFTSEEFAQWMIENALRPSKNLAVKFLQLISENSKAKKFFKGYKEEFQARAEDEGDFSPKLALKIFEYVEKNPQKVQISGSPFVSVTLDVLKQEFLESRVSNFEIEEEEISLIENFNQEENARLLEKITFQEELISKLKFDKNRINGENQRLQNISKKFEKSEEENRKLQDENDNLRNEVDALRSEIEDLKCRLRDASIATPQVTDSSDAIIDKLKEENLSLKKELEDKDSIIDGFISLVSSMQNLIKPVKNKSDKKTKKPDKPSRNVSKTVLNNSNRFTPDSPRTFVLRSHQVLQSFRTQEIRLRGWRTPRQTPYKATKPKSSTKNKTETLTKSLSLDELFEMKSLKVCLIREKKPEEMTEIIKLFADDSRYIQPYRESFDVKDFYAETKKDDFDIFVIFKDSTKHEFSEGVWWRGIENAVIFEFGKEKEGEDRSRISAQIKIIQKILEKSRELKGAQIA
ncbi:MAG: hypothetical protein WAV68_02460 [Candidatus Nanogingivalis sp.]